MLRVVTFCWLASVLICTHASPAKEVPLRFGVFPRWNAQTMVGNFMPLAHRLEKSLGREVHIESDKDFDSFMVRVNAGEFDLVHLNQIQYLQARGAAGYRGMVKLCEQPACTIRAQIITRYDSGIDTLADLRGRQVAFGDPNALVSYLFARRLLARAGLGTDEYGSLFTRNPPNALLTVYNGAAAAAGIGSTVLQRKEISRRIDISKLRVLAESEPIPPLLIAIRPELDTKLVDHLRWLLLELHQAQGGAEVLDKIGATHFAVLIEAEYTALEVLSREQDDGSR